MLRIKTFQTPRTTARQLHSDDFAVLYQMHINPEVMATLGGIRKAEYTQENLRWNVKQWQQHRFGLWLFYHKENKQFVGRGGIRKLEVAGKEQIELAYALMPEFWGRSYATEIAQAILVVAFNYYCLSELICFTLTTNIPSQKIMQKIGFRYESELVLYEHPHVLYRLTAEEYQERSKLTAKQITKSLAIN